VRLTEAECEGIEANLFPLARSLVSEWKGFPWRRRRGGDVTASAVHCSQALTIDVFETVKRLRSCNVIVRKWVAALFPRLESGRIWGITLEREVERELLREVESRTHMDVLLTSSRSMVSVQCVFTEPADAGCRLVRPLAEGPHEGKIQCNGEYRMQQSPINGALHRCAHSGKGIRYWQVIPQVLGYDMAQDIVPCPFAAGGHAWMRQLVAAHEIGRTYPGGPLQPAFLLVHAEGAFSAARHLRGTSVQDFIATANRHAVPMAVVSFQELIALARSVAVPEDEAVLADLAAWVQRKVRLASLT
jgi:hypothetical protein